MLSSVPLNHQFLPVNGLQLHAVVAGPVNGPPVILLHGFPEFWFGWRNQIPALAAAGYRVIVPDQRGYNLSSKPRHIAEYHLDILAHDIVSLMDVMGHDRCFVVGHDWGAAVAWWLAFRHPKRLRKAAMLNVPFPTLLFDAICSGNLEQLRRSWYILVFQIPGLAETGFRLANSGGRNILRASSRSGTFSDADLTHYRAAWLRPGAMRGMLSWYRAAGRSMLSLPRPQRGAITVPTLLLWGEKDIALGKELAQPSIDLWADGELLFFPEATHWLQHDEPRAVNAQLLRFLR